MTAPKSADPIQHAREARGGETMIRVAYSRWRPGCDPGSDGHSVRRGEVVADLGLETDAGQDFTSDEMQLITRAAKFAAIDCIRARKGARIRRHKEPLPRAVRELLRDVVLADYLDNATNDPKDAPLVAVWLASDGMLECAKRAARILCTTPDAIVARARKVRK